MTDKKKETEQQIFEAAQRVFQRSGYAGARMQEIADEAGINKSMLHYYYRSKDKLFQQVFQEGVKQFFPVIFNVLNSDLALAPKIEALVDTYYTMFEQKPHLPSFIIHEMNQNPDRFKEFIRSLAVQVPVQFIKQIKSEMEAGNIKPMDVKEFLINTIGLCVFPLVARPMIEVVFEMDEEGYRQFLENRKKELPKFILNAVKQ